LESFFADALLSDARLQWSGPQEQSSATLGSMDKAANIVGIASLFLVGVGYQKSILPHRILSFRSCPVTMALFVNDQDKMRSRFAFIVPQAFDPNAWKSKGQILIFAKGPGFLGSGERNELGIINPLHGDAPGLQTMSTDERLRSLLLGLLRTELIRPHRMEVKYLRQGALNIGTVEVELTNNIKDWRRGMEFGLNPQEFAVSLFGAVSSIAQHIQNHLSSQFGLQPQSRRALMQPSYNPSQTIGSSRCRFCGRPMQVGGAFCSFCGRSQG